MQLAHRASPNAHLERPHHFDSAPRDGRPKRRQRIGLTTADQTLILRETMKDLERRLDPRKFQRVHRSTIVNLDNVRQVKPHTNGECFLTLASGATVKVSRSYRDVVARFL